MKKFIIFVTRSPFDSLNGLTALSFCEAAVSLGHEISQVFFYQQGVQQGNMHIQPVAGEINMLSQWVRFSEQTKTPLNVCVTAASKRGLVNAEDAGSIESAVNVHPAFHAVGMAEYFGALAASKNSGDCASFTSIQF